jgi:L-seryl-tRNA(Ser) seleniumtransferase
MSIVEAVAAAEARRQLPAVGQLLASAAFGDLLRQHPRALVVEALRETLQGVRRRLLGELCAADALEPVALAADVSARIGNDTRRYYRRAINATGIVLHTGLGRARLSQAAVAAIADTSAGAVRLEINLDSGERGGRDEGCAALLHTLVGCEAATVVNNNAAATLLILAALARGKRIIVSRGELVEIGGSYRIPDVLRESGGVLTEVGTTNRTHLEDYTQALGSDVGLLLKVHTSNYRIEGFSHEVPVEALVELGRSRGVPVVHDLGSGSLTDLGDVSGYDEPDVRRSVHAGADAVCFSGDKLLGGPQSGVLVGTRAAIEACRRHPLYRVLRPGRLTYVALEATLRIYQQGDAVARQAIPTLRDLTASPAVLKTRAQRLAARLRAIDDIDCAVARCTSEAGGGSLPTVRLESWGVSVAHAKVSAMKVAAALRCDELPVLVRVRDDRVLMDVRTIEPHEIADVERCLRRALRTTSHA